MELTDLTVEVRDGNLNRVGQLLPKDLIGATFISRRNNVGSWSVRLPNGLPMAEALRSPGAGIIVTDPNGVLISGPTTSAVLEQSTDNPDGDWIIEGADDSIILAERLAYPTPNTADVTAQTQAHDIRTGPAETVIKSYVEDNISAAAGHSRAIPNLLVEPDLGRGESVTGNARFIPLQDLFFGLAQTGLIGYTVEQVGSNLVFQVYESTDRSSTIRMDIDNGQLTSTQYSYVSPKTTRAIVGGAGEAEDRLFYEGTTTESLNAETVWSRRIETFIDSRGTDLPEELTHAAEEELVDNGKTLINFSVTPSDDQNMRYGYDWGLGDKVTVVVGSTEAVAIVTEIGISIQADGVRIGATVGTPTPLDFESKLISKTSEQEARISNLERNATGYGVNVAFQPLGGTDGAQPTFSGPAISGTYNRFGNMVHFSLIVEFANITNFGTGQYFMTLPYAAKVAYIFRDGCLHMSTGGTQYHISGHVGAGVNTLYLFSSDKVASGVQDVPFTSTFPATLTTAGRFHIAGTYEIDL